MSGLKYIQLYHSYLDAIEPIGDAERGRLFTACLQYSKTGAAPELSGNERFIFPMMRAQIDRDNEAYEKKCRQNKNNRQGTSTDDDDRQGTSTGATKEKEKEKEKKKEKDNTPLSPQGEKGVTARSLVQAREYSEQVKAKVLDWLKYKSERRENYKPSGLDSFLTQVGNKVAEYGETAVLQVISESMANNYQGVTWDKLKSAGPPGHAGYTQAERKPQTYEEAKAMQEQKTRGDFFDAEFRSVGGGIT